MKKLFFVSNDKTKFYDSKQEAKKARKEVNGAEAEAKNVYTYRICKGPGHGKHQ